MAGELRIQDEGLEQEFLAQPTPIAFIDFETIMPEIPGMIQGTHITDLIPCQWSSHTMYEHGLEWEGNLRHGEFLWKGDVGWNPIYAFVQSLYEETKDAASIWIYTGHEVRTLKACMQCALNDMQAYNNGELSLDYRVIDMYGNKVPLRDIAPNISMWCQSIISRIYDQSGFWNSGGGIKYWIQSPELHQSNSIKYVMPAAMKEYSRSAELLQSQEEPPDGYNGLRAMGYIAKGDECQQYYTAALRREPNPIDAPDCAPFDPEIEKQCLIYCKLDTLSMVLIYLAVLEATQTWREKASREFATFAKLPYSNLIHSIIFDADTQTMTAECGTTECFDYSQKIQIYTVEELNNMNIADQYNLMCPHCRRIRNEAQ